MRIFFCDFHLPIFKKVALGLKAKGIDIIYWTGYKHAFDEVAKDKKNFPNTIFHNIYDAIHTIPARGIDESRFEPPGAGLIRDLLECEATTLTMMSKMDYGNLSLLEKKHLYYKYIQYWNGVLKLLKPDAILFFTVPHYVYNFVLYSLAEKLGIPVIILSGTVFRGRVITTRNYQEPQELRKAYREIENEAYNNLEKLSLSTRTYVENVLKSSDEAMPKYKKIMLREIKRPISFFPPTLTFLKKLKEKNFFEECMCYLAMLLKFRRKTLININKNDTINYSNIFQIKKFNEIKQKLKQEYLRLQDTVDFEKKYIYCPLHLQPESSTCPMADFFVDQILMVKILSAATPRDWLVYVKENIFQWNPHDYKSHLFRYTGYYKEMARLKNVRLISPDVSSFDLIEHAQATATATGTAGIESLIKTKSVLFFGHPWYKYCDGAFGVSDVETCKEAIRLIQEGRRPDFQKVLNYLIAFEKTSIKMDYLELKGGPKANDEEMKIAEKITQKLFNNLEKTHAITI